MPHCLRVLLISLLTTIGVQGEPWISFPPSSGPGHGRHIVLLSGDEEYRSEEGLPMLARLLADRHGFRCTVLFAIDPADGTINPNVQTNIPGMSLLREADLVVMLLRFRELPDADMKCFVDYLESGRPLIALRTSTHAFQYSRNTNSVYARFDWRSREWPGGFGQQILGDTWIRHHGVHGSESTRGIVNPAFVDHPILRGVSDIWGPTDVYGLDHLPSDAPVLVYGQVLSGMKPDAPPVPGPKNSPMMPIVWLREHSQAIGKTNRILATTMGAATDLESAGLRRLLVNSCYWTLGLEDKITATLDVRPVGEYRPSAFGFDKFKPGLRPGDLVPLTGHGEQ